MAFVKTEKKEMSALARLYRKLLRKRSKEEKHASSILNRSRSTEEEMRCSTSSSEIGSDDLRAVFDYMDANSDGKISPAEIQSCVSVLSGVLSVSEAEAVVKLADLNGDGFLDFEEFSNLMEGKGWSEEEKTKELKEAFGMYATEGNECITAASLRSTLSRLGESRSIDDCRAMIRAFDLNSDGVLNFDEFFLMMR